MELDNKYISELIEIRRKARVSNDYALSDKIRNYLDAKESFVFDTKEGQVVYHELKGMTRSKLIEKLNREKQANKLFDAWLYSMNKSEGINKVLYLINK
jgi:hypothetical protein